MSHPIASSAVELATYGKIEPLSSASRATVVAEQILITEWLQF